MLFEKGATMNREIEEKFANLYLDMVLAHQRWHGQSILGLVAS